MWNVIVRIIIILFMTLSCSCAHFDDYHGGPKDIQAFNKAMQDRQKKIDEKYQQQRTVVYKEEPQKCLAEFEKAKRAEYEKKLATLQKRYLDEYINNKEFQYITSAKDYDGIINNFLNAVKKLPETDKITLSKITKENLAISALIYADVNTILSILEDIFHEVNEKDKASGLMSSTIYGDILAERKKIGNIKAEIRGNAYTHEEALFKKITGFCFYDLGFEENALSTLMVNPQWKPEQGYLYSLRDMTTIQTIDKGILMKPYMHMYMHLTYDKTIFLHTNKNFVDGQLLEGHYAYYTGTFKYQSFVGTRNVYAFKLFHFNSNQNVNGQQFYFYPRIIDISKIEEKIIDDSLTLWAKALRLNKAEKNYNRFHEQKVPQ